MRHLAFCLCWPALQLACAGPEFTTDAQTSEVQGSTGGRSASGGSTSGGSEAGGEATSGGARTSGGAPGSGGVTSSQGGSGDAGSAGACADCTSRACRDLPVATPSGVYRIDPDGPGGLAPFDASCDMDSDGGGWTLILNYVHKAGTNPALAVRKELLPLLGSDQLGSDESVVPANWGHAAPTLVALLAPAALRFQGVTSAHERVIDFVTSDKNCITYFSGGTANCKGVATAFTPSARHTATLPGAATAFMSGKGELSMTEFPFYVGGLAHWGIRGEGKRWEVDTTPLTGQLGNGADTLHRVWAR